jgi:predicted ATP-grasp superfamily ATP-dependent carboligase
MTHVLVAGVSTRVAAESAARAGFAVTAIDAFGDLDQHPSVGGLALPHNFTARAAAMAARTVECDAVVYLSSFENHPKAITTLAEGRALWGNSPETVRRVRDPLLLAEALRRRGFSAPEVRLKPDTTYPVDTNDKSHVTNSYVVSGFGRTVNQWLVKPLASGGGQRIHLWDPTTILPRGCYLQEFINGPAGSVVFVAAGGRAVPIGVSRLLVGEPAFGAEGFEYCGNILTVVPRDNAPEFSRDEALVEATGALAQAVVDEFGLVGVNGIDFIARGVEPCAVEVNPRWCASMELVERAYGLSVFEAHASACAVGRLPDFDFVRARRGAAAAGKAIIYARHDVTVGDTRTWLTKHESIRDIPRPGASISSGRPVCTILADAPDTAACHAALLESASRLYAQLEAWCA